MTICMPPLRGAHRGPARRTLATWVAMLASGLWHGASWNFVLWGAWHALWITVYRVVEPRIPDAARRLGRAPAVALWFFLTCGGWVLFRATDLGVLGRLGRTPLPTKLHHGLATVVVFEVALLYAAPLVLAWVLEPRLTKLTRSPWRLPLRTTGYSLLILLIWLFGRDGSRDFVYFRF